MSLLTPAATRNGFFSYALKSWLLVSVLLLLGLGGPIFGQPRVVPEHPRLFLRAADVATVKGRCRSHPEVKAAYERLRQFAYSEARNPNLWVAPDELSSVLLAYVVEDRDPKLLARARGYLDFFAQAQGDSWTRPRMLKALAQAYDWLHADLSAEEKEKLVARLTNLAAQMRKQYRHADYNNHVYLEHGPLLYAGLALAGDGAADDFARQVLAEGEKMLKEHFIPTVNQVGGTGQGGWHESMSYWSFFAYEFAQQLEAWRTATGEDLFKSCNGLSGAANWLVYATRPHDGSFAPVANINTPARWGWQETAYLPLLAARYRDGVAQQAALQVPIAYASRTWPFVLWFDPKVKATPFTELPLATLFPGVGWAAMRGSWEKDAVWALFVCGDYYAGHQHYDQNSFVIARRGDLAVDAGEYGAKETLFHNTVLIGEGQRFYQNDPRRYFGPTVAGGEFDTGDIVAFEENRYFTYVVGDASNAYGVFKNGRRVGEAPRFVRRFLFLKPDTFVVADEVRAPGVGTPIKWLLHTRNEPSINGRTLRAADGDGELVCETLWPVNAVSRSVREVAGQKQRASHRIEITPPAETRQVEFLHVLQARSRGEERSVARAELAEKDSQFALTVAAGENIFRLNLPRAAAERGTIEVTKAGGEVLLAQRLLPAGILPYGPEGPRLLERWDSAYRRDGPAGWDTGRPSTELKKAVENGTLRSGRALELGGGTGNNAIYLASQGFTVTEIDIAPTALRLAEAKAKEAGVQIRFLLADVLAAPKLEPFDVIFDRGCYHGVRRANAAGYVETLRQMSRPGTRVLILAGNANEPPPHYGPPRVKEEELRADFSKDFEFEWLREIRFDTADPNRPGALAWSILLKRKGEPSRD